jgi:hypothetical protein
MTYAEIRELVRVRHELRRVAAEGRREEAQRLCERLRALAESDPDERAEVEPEIVRWETRLGSC